MVRTPSFRYMGGKSRLRKWLISHFPPNGRKYIEPFAGLGNVFYQAKKDLDFSEWELGDINDFLTAINEADFNDMPDTVNKSEFLYWKSVGNYISKIIEPKITFAGKGYKSGFGGGHPKHPPYNGKLHRILCEEARRLLDGVSIKHCCWTEWDYDNLTEMDFVYFDPPYFGTKASYSNIDHNQLVETLNKANFKWALSGYDNDLYKSSLNFKNVYIRERNSEIKSANRRKYTAVNEYLWVNYDKKEKCRI